MLGVPGNIDLWWGTLSDLAPDQEFYVSVLSEDEKSRVRAYRFAERGRAFALIRGWLRTALAPYCGEDPARLQIGYETNGKPILIQHPISTRQDRIEFNLSHSDDHFVLAVTRGNRVGLDLERIRKIDHMDTIARMYFSKSDYEVFRQEKERKQRRFFELWTQLEARYKAFGPDRSELDPHLQEGPVYSQTWEPAPGYIASLVSEREDGALRWISWKGIPVKW